MCAQLHTCIARSYLLHVLALYMLELVATIHYAPLPCTPLRDACWHSSHTQGRYELLNTVDIYAQMATTRPGVHQFPQASATTHLHGPLTRHAGAAVHRLRDRGRGPPWAWPLVPPVTLHVRAPCLHSESFTLSGKFILFLYYTNLRMCTLAQYLLVLLTT